MKHFVCVGDRFARLVTTKKLPGNPNGGGARWTCACDCGGSTEASTCSLRSGKVKSCGCLRKEFTSTRSKTHGMSRSPTYKTWLHMRERCSDPASKGFANYGGRGIRVCPRWATFENFLADMGAAPVGHTLERVNNDGNYEPDNCVWATRTTQANNRRSNVCLSFQGKTMTIAEWALEINVSQRLLGKRYRAGWPVERVLDIRKRTNQYG